MFLEEIDLNSTGIYFSQFLLTVHCSNYTCVTLYVILLLF